MASKMAPDLLDQIKNVFSGEILNRIGSTVGLSPAKTTSALDSLIPAVLAGVAGKAATTDGANDVVDVIRRNNLSSLDMSELTRPEAVTNLTSNGQSLMDFALGGRVNSVTDWIASHVGINRAAVTSLASLCVPAVLGIIGRRLGSSGLNASSLSSLLGGPSRFLQYAPAGIAGALGLGGAAAGARRFVDDTEKRVGAAPAYVEKPTSSFWKWLLPLLFIAALVGLLGYLFSRRPETATVVTPPTRTEAPPPPTAPIVTTGGTDLGAFVDTKLPNGVSLHIPSYGVENKLLSFIQDNAKAVDKTTWFSFDRLEFETDSAQLKPSSREQLANVAAILKAYPNVSLKIGGYTDNSGDVAHNLKLSQDRATSTLNELVNLGVAKSRLDAEGYGEQFPVADNGTPEGRQRNRRIDIRVTKK